MILGSWAETRIPTCNFFRENFLENGATKNPLFQRVFSLLFGVPGIEPGSYPPQGQILPLYYTPSKDYFFFAIALMHFVQAFTLLPERSEG